MSKVRVFVGARIPNEDIWKRFVAYVARKHGTTYRVLGEELEKALKTYLKAEETSRARTHGDGGVSQPVSPGAKTLRRIRSRLRGRLEVLQGELKDIIGEAAGFDPRTYLKYLSLLQAEGTITLERRGRISLWRIHMS